MSQLAASREHGDAMNASRPKVVSSRIGAAMPPPDQASRLRMMVHTLSSGGVSGAGASPAEGGHRVAVDAPPLIAFTSGKGGVGKTSLSVNLAIALRQVGVRVTLVDGDLGLANADVMCGVSPVVRLDAVMTGRSMDSIAIEAPGGIRLVPGSVGLTKMADLHPGDRAHLLSAFASLSRQSDAVILDTGAGISGPVLSFLGAADAVVVVATPEPTSMTDAYALIKCLQQRQSGAGGARAGRPTRRLLLLVNQASSHAEAERVHARLNAVCERFLKVRLEFLGAIGMESEVSLSIRRRRPLILSHPRIRWSREVETVAKALADAMLPSTRVGLMHKPQQYTGLRAFVASLLGT